MTSSSPSDQDFPSFRTESVQGPLSPGQIEAAGHTGKQAT